MKNRESLRVGLAIAAIGGALSGCNKSPISEGDLLTASRDTTCWQCPGGEKTLPGNPYTCANQIRWGNLSEDETVKVISNGYNFEDQGYLRVDTPKLSTIDPTTGEEIDLSGRICWVDGKDLKK